MAEDLTQPYFGNPNVALQGARARELAQQRNAESLPDPRTYGFVSGLFGTSPDQLGMSVLSPNTAPAKEAAYYGYQAGNAAQIAPALKGLFNLSKGMTAGQTVAAEAKPLMGYHRTTTPFEGDFVNTKNKLGVSFAGDRGFYFSPKLDDPDSQIFGKYVIAADVNVKNPAPVYQVNFGMDNYKTPRSVVPVDSKWLKENPEAIKEGGIAIADSVEALIAGKTAERAGSFKDYEQQVIKAAKNKKLFALIDPEKLYDKQVKLLESRGFDGFNYVRPETATSSMPSQIVAFRPEQIKRKASGKQEQIIEQFTNPTYQDPMGFTIK